MGLAGIQRGGMELHVFEVVQTHARALRHRDAGAGAGRGVGGVQVDLPHAARGEHGEVRQQGFDLAGVLVVDVGAEALVDELVAVFPLARMVVRGDQVDRGAAGEYLDVRRLAHGLKQALHDRLAGVVRAVKDAVLAVSAFAGEVELAVHLVEGNGRALHEDAFHGVRSVLAEVAHRPQIVVVMARHQNVRLQRFRVVGTGPVDDAALRQRGVAAVEFLTGDDERHFIPGVRQGERRRAAADACADDEDLCS